MESNLAIRAETASDEPFIFYHYQVSMPAAIIFVVLFGLATALHLFQMFRSRTWFMVPFVIGAGFEVAGYVGRILNATENPGPYTLIPYIIQSIFLLVAPALLAASIYMELGRIVMMVQGEDCLFIRRTRLTKTFVVGDIIAFMLQAAGGGLQASKKAKTVSFSKKILLVSDCPSCMHLPASLLTSESRLASLHNSSSLPSLSLQPAPFNTASNTVRLPCPLSGRGRSICSAFTWSASSSSLGLLSGWSSISKATTATSSLTRYSFTSSMPPLCLWRSSS